jgi:hypothetical protein
VATAQHEHEAWLQQRQLRARIAGFELFDDCGANLQVSKDLRSCFANERTRGSLEDGPDLRLPSWSSIADLARAENVDAMDKHCCLYL